MSVEIARHSFTVEEFERMGEAGIFPPDARLELIEGEIVELSPIGSPHAACVTYLTHILNELEREFQVRVQNPVWLSDFSEPQPDLALVHWRDDFYRGAHPSPADVLLVVEVADTTVITDRSIKLPLYARAGIREAWLVNIPDGRIEIFSDPSGDTYQRAELFERGRQAQSHTIERLKVTVEELLG
jgi:Uma2 family endonuclease